ncbi:MAG TPA: secondary thiamine-phosphate synthase enzyme YjbQ [Methylomirabilota bacterium]|nr:secondary thiamine-phosphate synthase enzyme YjbQ [Methylomirabilota bacterium]
MKFIIEKLSVKSSKATELIRITEEVRKTVQLTGLKNGIVNVFTLHTTTGITINEDDKKLEDDIARFLVKLVPEDDSYAHHRFFRKDGRMAVNAYSHIRASLLGASVAIPLQDGSLVLGSRQNIYLVDLDGPQTRGLVVQVVGE